jgi:MFS family permease
MMGIFYAAPLLGPSLGPLLGGVLTQAFSWRAAFWLLAALLGIDLVLFTFFFRDTFRRERSLTYRRALARRRGRPVVLSPQPDAAADAESTKVPVVALDVVDTIESKEKIVLGNGPSSPSSACATTGDDMMQAAEITLSLADVNPFPPLLLVLRRRNNVTTLIASGTTYF